MASSYKKPSNDRSPASSNPHGPQELHQPAPPTRSTHQIPREDKGKEPLQL